MQRERDLRFGFLLRLHVDFWEMQLKFMNPPERTTQLDKLYTGVGFFHFFLLLLEFTIIIVIMAHVHLYVYPFRVLFGQTHC